MYPTQHYKRGEELMKQAETAIDPTRLIGLAQCHFLAAQTGLQAWSAVEGDSVARSEWVDVFRREVKIDPQGRVIR
jgi:hypothetical protein